LNPAGHGAPRDTKDTRDAAQRRALVIGPQNLGLALRAARATREVGAQTAATGATQKALFAIGGASVANDTFTAAMITVQASQSTLST